MENSGRPSIGARIEIKINIGSKMIVKEVPKEVIPILGAVRESQENVKDFFQNENLKQLNNESNVTF